FGSPPRTKTSVWPSELHTGASISTPRSPENRVNCRDVKEPFAEGSATQMLRLPSASKIHAIRPPAGAAVRPLGKAAVSAASIVNDGFWPDAVSAASAAAARSSRGRVTEKSGVVRELMSASMVGGVRPDYTP